MGSDSVTAAHGLRNPGRQPFPHFTVANNVALVPSLENWEASRINERVRELLWLVGLDPEKYGALSARVSGGQRQRIGVARALAAEPPLLLLDEPLISLDPLTRASLQRQFVDLTRRLGKTAIFVTHDLREALRLGSRIGLMRGTVGAAGNARAFSNPRKNMRALIWKRSSYRWKTSPMEEARELLAISPTKLEWSC